MSHRKLARLVVVLGLPSVLLAGGRVDARAPGDPAPDCVEGWSELPAGTQFYEEALDLIRGQMGIDGEFQVDVMRYFLGPDVPWIIEPHFDVVRRWYVKASLVDDPEFRGRWLVEYRDDDRKGISAVAPYDTVGYQSPDWHGFVGEGPPREVPGLPGLWPGLDYDFVTGEGDSGNPGLPDEVVGCMAEGEVAPPPTLPPSGASGTGNMAATAALFVASGAILVQVARRRRMVPDR